MFLPSEGHVLAPKSQLFGKTVLAACYIGLARCNIMGATAQPRAKEFALLQDFTGHRDEPRPAFVDRLPVRFALLGGKATGRSGRSATEPSTCWSAGIVANPDLLAFCGRI